MAGFFKSFLDVIIASLASRAAVLKRDSRATLTWSRLDGEGEGEASGVDDMYDLCIENASVARSEDGDGEIEGIRDFGDDSWARSGEWDEKNEGSRLVASIDNDKTENKAKKSCK